MRTSISPEVLTLAQTYAGFYVEDFTTGVMSQLKGSFKVSPEVMQEFLASKSDQIAAAVIKNESVVSRFVLECAQFAQERLPDPESKDTWDVVKDLPSVHHSELTAIQFSAAASYKNTFNTTMMKTVLKDAHIATETISAMAQSRASSTETGGTLHVYDWDVLNDGMWLTGALIKAHDVARIFRPNEPVAQRDAQTAFNFARQMAPTPFLEHADQVTLFAELDLLVSQAGLEGFTDQFGQDDLSNLLFKGGKLYDTVRSFEEGLTDMGVMMQSIKTLSLLARSLPALIDVAHAQSEDTQVSQTTVDRLRQAEDVVTLALSGFEVLRETTFNQSIILSVSAPSDDPVVDVVVNGDLMNTYHRHGGQDEDLVNFGVYFDPRKGLPMQRAGLGLEFLMSRKDDILPKVLSEQQDRLAKRRFNDSLVIEQGAEQIIRSLTNSYLHASAEKDARFGDDLDRKISRLARQTADAGGSLQMDHEIVNLLLPIVGDAQLSSMTQALLSNLRSESATVKQYAAPLAIAEMALEDALMFISNPDLS